MTYDALQAAALTRSLTILGGFHPAADDGVPPGFQTLLLLGPHEPGFWASFTQSPEWQDGAPDPMDRWSTRVIDAWAADLDALALYPFGGPPFKPFFSWALKTGRVHASPIMLLVHDSAGLFVSFRGALALRDRIDLPPNPANPCLGCIDQPCTTTCPVDALDGKNYDVVACKTFLEQAGGQDCMAYGCAARRVCPVSQQYPRTSAQSAYHMTTFKG
ncbi:ferredoxin [Roseobacter denitrificans]|uniref:4Fe-4S ferredoxin-type domain-containing protein n=1 Tax=Roseobacter denitrificans (strain ATCC 33942 / OCh 114) TaxID=375451 RepID=Q16AA6_ROSDO|nr:hypothetical protein [Roseobacter denitrificans]ABG31087.1 conserved hypothetical protein [Roseobacter denitrificans OCh 114]AVL54161.1 ferredoxin [Roseobacter denitrificans]SFG33117.1 hypothetical protein SAMN05443635_11385 [Roseobacter denitrificans OCh 114]